MLMFPDTVDSSILQLIIAPLGDYPATVTIDSPSAITFSKQLTIPPRESKTVSVRGEMQASGIGGERKGIHISSTADIEVLAFSGRRGSCGGFNVIPVDALGFNYYAMAWWPEGFANNLGEIGVVATEDQTRVRFLIQPSKGVSFSYDGRVYDENATPLEVMLDKYETFQLQNLDSADITGTKIEADKRVAVFSGMKQTNIGDGRLDHIVEQMTPLHAWGRTFGVVPFPEQPSGYRVKVVGSAADTTVYINGQRHDIRRAGGFVATHLGSSSFVAVTANKPVLVAQFVESPNNDQQGAPSMVLIPPVEQFKHSYRSLLPTGPSSYKTYLQSVAVKGNSSLLASWTDIPNTSPSLVGLNQHVTSGGRLFLHKDVLFGGYVYGAGDAGCGFAYQLGACLADIREVGPIELSNFETHSVCYFIIHLACIFLFETCSHFLKLNFIEYPAIHTNYS